MSETCYVVATLDTRTLKVTDVGFYSASAHGLTTMRNDCMYLDVYEFDGVDYHHACLAAYNYILSKSCPTYLEWLRPFAKKKEQETRYANNHPLQGRTR